MFTTISIVALVCLALYGQRASNQERKSVGSFDDDLVRQSVIFARDDLKLIALILAAILIMLGNIADRIH